MLHPKIVLLAGLMLPLLAALVLRAGGAKAAPAGSCAWQALPAPNPSGNDQLNAIAAASATDVWAVGYASGTTLIKHWNGTRWSVVSSPNPAGYDRLSGVAVVPGSTQVWAEGIQGHPPAIIRP